MKPETVAYELLRIGKARFAYHRAGQGGVWIVLLHGWPQTSWAWRRVTPLLDISEDRVRGREYLFVEHFRRREKVGIFDPNSVSASDIEHDARALARPGAVRSSFNYARTIPIDRDDNRAWGADAALDAGSCGRHGKGIRRRIGADHTAVGKRCSGCADRACGHYPAEERPAKLETAIRDFLAKRDPAPAAGPAVNDAKTHKEEHDGNHTRRIPAPHGARR